MINKKWFTLVELVVTVTILAIISTIGFVSYSSYLWDARDSQRKSDLSQVSSALKVYKQKRWYYPLPWDYFNIIYNSETIAFQWKLNNNVRLNTLDSLPLDPKIGAPYLYSIVNNKQEYQLAATLENTETPLALVVWNYSSVAIDTLPWIILALERDSGQTASIIDWETDSESVDWSVNKNKFIFDNQDYNLPYTFTSPYKPSSNWTEIDDIIDELEENNSYWQNADYRTCLEIEEAWKAIQDDNSELTYQIITDDWVLEDIECEFPSS